MNYIYKSWMVEIDITSVCKKHCIYCTRHLGHVSAKERYMMSLEQVSAALDSLYDWPNKVGIIGGEPLMHPQLKEIAAMAAERIPKERLALWTSGLPGTALEDPREVREIADYFGCVYFNPHDAAQVSICRHQPLTIAIEEVVPDKGMMWKLINNCWLPRLWSPTITNAGAYFCEVAGSLDAILHQGRYAWKVEPGWWKRPPEAFQEQAEKLCPRCGMCLPMERQHLIDSQEKFTPRLLEDFRKNGAIRMGEPHVAVFDKQLTNKEIIEAARDWYPTNYRDDLNPDEALQPWEKGVLASLEPGDVQPNVFHLDSDRDFEEALKTIGAVESGEEPREFGFYFEGRTFYPLREQYPFVLPDRPRENLLYFRAMLLHFRQTLNDKDFEALRAEGLSREKLTSLAHVCRQQLISLYNESVSRLGESLAGQEVYFWGFGAAWRHFRERFSKTKPRCFLSDLPGAANCGIEADGIPIRHPEALFKEGAEPLTSVLFVKEEYARWADSVREKYSGLIKGTLHLAILK